MGKIFRIPVLGTAIGVSQDRHGAATRSKSVAGTGQFESQLFAKVIQDAEFEDALDPYGNKILDDRGLPVQVYKEGTGRERAPHEYFGNRKDASKLTGRAYNSLVKAWYFALYRGKTMLPLGSGLTTNVAALAHANEAVTLAGVSTAPIHLMHLANYHATGTGATAAAATDIKLQTYDSLTVQAGAQSTVSAANSQKYQTVATITGYGTEAVTEWGLHSSSTLSSTTGTPFTNTSATTFTATATPFTASTNAVQGLQQQIVVAGTTTVWGLITTNTTSVGTLVGGWYKVADGTAGSTPGTTEAYTLRPILYDHKVFSAINTVSGDTIQFTYQLTIASGN